MANKSKKKNSKIKSSQEEKAQDFLSKISAFPLSYLIVFIFSLFVFAQIFSFEIGKLDEDHLISNKIEMLKDITNVNKALTTDAFWGIESSNFYRPVQNLTFLLNGVTGNGSSWTFYLSNFLIHLISCLSLLYLLSLLKADRRISFALVLFFAVNPLFAYSVAWLPARGDLLIGMLGILGLVFLELELRNKNWIFLILNAVCVFIAIFAKETAILFPLLYIGWWLFAAKEKFNSKAIALTALYALSAIAFFASRQGIASTDNSSSVFGVAGLISNLQVFPELLGKFFIPYNLSPMPDYNLINTIIGLIFIFLLAFFLSKTEKPHKIILIFGLLWFLAFTVPGAMYVHKYKEGAYAYLEHRAYLPIIGIVIFLVIMAKGEYFKKHIKNVSIGFLALSIIFAFISFSGLQLYKAPLDYYNLSVEKNPKSAVARYNRGVLLNKLGKPEEAFQDFNQAITLKSDYAEPYVNRGAFLLAAGNVDAALKDMETSLAVKPEQAETNYNIAQIKNSKGKSDEALKYCIQAIKLDPKLFDPHLLLGNIYFNKGDFAKAVESYSAALSIRANDAGAFNNRGSANFLAGRAKEAIKDFDAAISLKPDYADAYKNRGMAKNSINDKEGALLDWTKAAKRGNRQAEDLIKQAK